MQFRRVIDNPEGICILHNDPGIAQNLEITEQKSEVTLTNLTAEQHQKIPFYLAFYFVCITVSMYHVD